MKFLVIILTFFSISLAELTISSGLNINKGSLLYDLEAPAESELSGGYEWTSLLMSELEYPVHPYSPMISIEYIANKTINDKERTITLFVSGKKGIGTSSVPMKDSDWIGVRTTGSGNTSTVRQKFSYTESEMDASSYEICASTAMSMFTLFGKNVHIGLQFEYGTFNAKMYSISGWQYGVVSLYYSEKFYFEDLFKDTLVLTYDAYYFVPYLTSELFIIDKKNKTLSLNLNFSPYSVADDNDDHVLRKKRIHTSSNGWAIASGLNFSVALSERLALKSEASFRWIKNEGQMDQEWYEDEVYENVVAVPKGTKLYNIPAHFKSLTGLLSLQLSWKL
jgi:hypothetical protein